MNSDGQDYRNNMKMTRVNYNGLDLKHYMKMMNNGVEISKDDIVENFKEISIRKDK